MTTRKKLIYSNYASPPGGFLQEEAEARGILVQELADRCEKSVEEIKKVFRGAQEITPELATALEQAVTGIKASFWLNLEADYQETLRRNGESRPE